MTNKCIINLSGKKEIGLFKNKFYSHTLEIVNSTSNRNENFQKKENHKL